MPTTKPLSRVAHLLRAMRPTHWVKNVVVFAAPLFALVLEGMPWLRVAWAFVAFSGAASGFYLINDVMDREADRAHPAKRHRPIAAGLVSAPLALGTAGVLMSSSLVVSWLVAPWLTATVGAYMLVQAGYNAGLKHEPILDIMCIAGGFVLRALAGAAAAQVPASGWFILCVGLLAFFLGIEKRKAELKALGDEAATRAVLDFYSRSWLHRMESVVTASALMSYALWTLEGAETPWMLATLPFVAYGIFRYQYLAEQGKAETPERALLRDPKIILTVLFWATSCLLILYISARS